MLAERLKPPRPLAGGLSRSSERNADTDRSPIIRCGSVEDRDRSEVAYDDCRFAKLDRMIDWNVLSLIRRSDRLVRPEEYASFQTMRPNFPKLPVGRLVISEPRFRFAICGTLGSRELLHRRHSRMWLVPAQLPAATRSDRKYDSRLPGILRAVRLSMNRGSHFIWS